jgi:hypothetical protein
MMRDSLRRWHITALALICAIGAPVAAHGDASEFKNGFPRDPNFFPIGVWLQETHRAASYKDMGVNTYVGLWDGPREEQLADLANAGLYVIAEQNDVGLSSDNAGIIKAWMQQDEPDNAQPKGDDWGDCIMPDQIKKTFAAMRKRDPTRPVWLNFGQGVVNREWVGRGEACAKIDHDAYYSDASRGADILSFDIYPVSEVEQAHVAGRLELVGDGVAQLQRWATPAQPVWTVIETTHIQNPKRRPTGAEIRSMVWMAVIRGARGITYFVHEWQPSFSPDAIFLYPEIVASVTLINSQLSQLAPVINGGVDEPITDNPDKLVAMARRHNGSLYIFAANPTNAPIEAKFSARGLSSRNGTVIDESRFVRAENDTISDNFSPYGVHLYVFKD